MKMKKEALEKYLNLKVNPSDYDENTFETEDGEEYKVYTDKEADEAVSEYILYSLWAFNADFILDHSEAFDNLSLSERREAIESLTEMQGKLCENANGLVRCLISDIDEFIEDAVVADGRGHFLSGYDGVEIDLEHGLFAYRTN